MSKLVLILVSLLIFFRSETVFAIPTEVPQGPDPQLTTGALCDHPTRYRFKQKIAYCTRNVSKETKEIVFQNYDSKYQLRKNGYSRPQFKIDHYVPLCLGGSNDPANLWPQHLSISEITDPIENLLCMHLQKGLIDQNAAIDLIKRAKLDLGHASEMQLSLEKALTN